MHERTLSVKRVTLVGLGLATLVVGLFFGAGPLVQAFQTSLAPRIQLAVLLGPVALLAVLVAGAFLVAHYHRATMTNLTRGRDSATNINIGFSEVGEGVHGGPAERDTLITEPVLHRVTDETTATALGVTVDDVTAKDVVPLTFEGHPVARLAIPHGFESVSTAYGFHTKHRSEWLDILNELTEGREFVLKQTVHAVGVTSASAPLAYEVALNPVAQVTLNWVVSKVTLPPGEPGDVDPDDPPAVSALTPA
jgi:hypothetical protein